MRLFRRAVEMSPLEISRSARVRSQRSPRQFLLAKWVSSGLVSTATDARVKIAARMTSIYRASVKSAQLTEDRPTPSADAIASRPFPCSRRVRARPARSGVMTVGRPGAFDDHAAFYLSERGHGREEEFSACGGGVESFSEGTGCDAAFAVCGRYRSLFRRISS